MNPSDTARERQVLRSTTPPRLVPYRPDSSKQRLVACNLGLSMKSKLIRDPSLLPQLSSIFLRSSSGLLREDHLREFLPLPVPRDSPEEGQWGDLRRGRSSTIERGVESIQLSAGVSACVWVIVVALDCLYTGAVHVVSNEQAISPGQSRAMNLIRLDAHRFVSDGGEDSDLKHDWEDELRRKSTSYWGESLGTAEDITLDQLHPGLPPAGTAAGVEARRLLTGRTKELLLHPSECILPRAEWPSEPPRSGSHIAKGESEKVARAWVESGICGLIRKEKIFHARGKLVINTFFGVRKAERFLEDGRAILRLIMNLVPTNCYQRVIRGDVERLPFIMQRGHIILDGDQLVVVSQEDMSAAFYIFLLPEGWLPFFAFDLKLDDQHLCSRVLPMGWISAVGIMQPIHRNVLRSCPPHGAGLPAEEEMKKGRINRVAPKGSRLAGMSAKWWQAYLDNFAAGKVVGC